MCNNITDDEAHEDVAEGERTKGVEETQDLATTILTENHYHMDKIVYATDICAYAGCKHGFHIDLDALLKEKKVQHQKVETNEDRRKRLRKKLKDRAIHIAQSRHMIVRRDEDQHDDDEVVITRDDRPMMKETVPCINCFGMVRYCSIECMIRDRPSHGKACFTVQNEMRSYLFNSRMFQFQSESRGYPNLMQHLLTKLDRDELLSNVYFVRMPNNPKARINLTHPVRAIARNCLAKYVGDNKCMRDTYRALLENMKGTDNGFSIDTVYFVAYAPDMMMTVLTIVPFEEATKLREADVSVKSVTTLCPCVLHKGPPPRVASKESRYWANTRHVCRFQDRRSCGPLCC